ncbi:MAG: DUF4352 domain-containing protein [Erysipelotrichia bacterium]|nr:DUF4352 domain-containing protein [Erysipelotrichia bacterium]
MDVLKKDKNNHVSHLLIKDHIPNPAFINEFQTNDFTLKLNTMELVSHQLEGYQVDEGGQFLVLHLMIRNNTNEILDLYREDFLLSYDEGEDYNPEEFFNVPYQFKDEFALKPLETIKGCLVFVIAANAKKITFSHNEYYDDEHYKNYHLRYRF